MNTISWVAAAICATSVAASPRLARAQEPSPAVLEVLGPHGLERFPPLYARALDTLLVGEELYRRRAYAECVELLERLWSDHPPGSRAWEGCRSPVPEVFAGTPGSYYALRMLSTCARWRLALEDGEVEPVRAREAVLTVVLVGQSAGLEPRTAAQLANGEGTEAVHALEPALVVGDHGVVHQSLDLLREFVAAITDGRLALRVEVVHLPDLRVAVEARPGPPRHAGLADGALARVWEQLPERVHARTDWWWVLYPSHVPERHPDFARTEFITGGMAVGPDGGSPCFLIDDRWLVRKPPHLGRGPWTDAERRAYLPQWLLHELAHHLFRTWPRFGLEERGHQWFDRSSWPEDFEGRFEPDYIVEAIEKRLRPQADPPLHAALRYAPPPRKLLARLSIDQVCGAYSHHPVQNDWHVGSIERTGERRGGAPLLRWRNRAGVSWELQPDLPAGLLRTGSDNPYQAASPERERAFRLVLRRGADGEFLPEIEGFRFLGGLYARTP